MGKTRRVAGGWLARCPAHEDRTPSLKVDEGSDGTVLLHCKAGCDIDRICSALGIAKRDLFPPREPGAGPLLRELADHFGLPLDFLAEQGLSDSPEGVKVPYRNEAGKFLFNKTRTNLTGHPKYICDRGARMVPYGLWRGKRGKRLYVVEGESDCWVLWKHGYDALGVPGASMASVLRPEMFADVEDLVVIREADQAGKEFAAAVLQQCPRARAVDLGAKDVCELYQRGNFEEAFRKAVGERPVRYLDAVVTITKQFPPRVWLVDKLLPLGLTMFAGPPKLGKTRLMTNVALAVAQGGFALGAFPAQQAGALYYDLEGTEADFKERLENVLQGALKPESFLHAHSLERIGEGCLEELERFLDLHNEHRLVVVDVIGRVWPTKAPREFGNVKDLEEAILTELHAFAQRRQIGLVLVSHPHKGKNPEDELSEITGTSAMVTVPDTIWKLRRRRGEPKASLMITGRGLPEQVHELRFDMYLGTWRADGVSTQSLGQTAEDLPPF